MSTDPITVIVKTFQRQQCLEALLVSLAGRYPGLRVVVVDDSREPYAAKLRSTWPLRMTAITLPFDMGLAHGRNVALEHVTTPWTCLMDDDFILTDASDLPGMVKEAEAFDLDLLGGVLLNGGKMTHWECIFRQVGSVLVCEPLGTPLADMNLCHMTHNFWVGRTRRLQSLPVLANPKLKIGCEHIDMFIRFWKAGFKVGYAPRFRIENTKYSDHGYATWRGRNDDYLPYLMADHQLSHIVFPYGACIEDLTQWIMPDRMASPLGDFHDPDSPDVPPYLDWTRPDAAGVRPLRRDVAGAPSRLGHDDVGEQRLAPAG